MPKEIAMNTIESVSKILSRSICDSEETYTSYIQRLGEGAPTRDENPKSHFCAYFLPYDSANKKVFIVHHKKSGLWLSPGGHIDKGETLELMEKIGASNRADEARLSHTSLKNYFSL